MSQQSEQDLYARIAKLAESDRFSTLRMKCPNIRCEAGKIRSTMTEDVYPHKFCAGRSWVPELDLERACWQLSLLEKQVDDINFTTQYRDGQWEWYDPKLDVGPEGPGLQAMHQVASAEEAQVRAAEAWLKEERER